MKGDDVDAVFLPGPLTNEHKELISEFIRVDEEKRTKKHGRKLEAANSRKTLSRLAKFNENPVRVRSGRPKL